VTRLALALRGVGLPAALEQPLRRFSELFQKWNRSINLSAARSEAELLEHIVDSLHVVPHLRAVSAGSANASPRVLDVGAGGGLPAAIVAICLPDVQVTALEPVHKKHAFLRTAARELALANLDPHAERIDDHGSRDYDAAMSRATFDLRDWLLLGLASVRPGGTVLGFEALPRADLPAGTQRHPYALEQKARAIVVLHRS
jgi:16S rRNA (guanine527-N7)-methyltransferase